VPVEVARAELGTAARFITATGTVEPLRTIAINAQASGALLSVNVQEGTSVQAGTVLARVDSRELTAQMASARANLEVAQRAAERSQQLRNEQIITVAEYERDQAALAAARATFEQLETRLGYATIRSPIAGVVLEKRVETGDIVSPQTRLFTVGDISTLVVRVPISELDVAGLSVGDVVDVTLDALPDRSIQGRVLRVFPSADTVTRLVPVEVALSGSSGRAVRPGFLARVSLRLDPRTNVLMVPAAALLEDPSGAVVYLVQNGKASRRRVRRGETYQGRVEIVDGISEGDVVIVAGNTMVREGAAVRVIDPKTGTSPSTIGSDASAPAPVTAEAVR
jgi:RND family efflux transporter MFP subunit